MSDQPNTDGVETRIDARAVASALSAIGDAFHQLAKAVAPCPDAASPVVTKPKEPGPSIELPPRLDARPEAIEDGAKAPITTEAALRSIYAVLQSRPGGVMAAMDVLTKFRISRIAMAKPEQYPEIGKSIYVALKRLPERRSRGRKSTKAGTPGGSKESDDADGNDFVSLPETRVSIWKLFSDLCGTEEGKARAREILREFGIVRIEDAGEHQLDMIGEALRAAIANVRDN